MKRKLTLNAYNSDPPDQNHASNRTLSGISVFHIVSDLLNRRRLIIYSTLSVMVVVAAIVFLSPNLYTSTCTILPSGESSGNISKLTALAGLGGLTTGDENSSELFPVILNSESIRSAVLNRNYEIHDDDKTVNLSLSEYFNSENPDVLDGALRKITSIVSNKKTGVMEISVETEYPELSRAIVEEYVDQLETFLMHDRHNRSGDQARYLANQLETTRAELDIAEDSLEEYQKSNSDWVLTSDPQTLKELGRLKRSVTIKSQTYVYLMQEYVAAMLDTQKDVPVVRILDKPAPANLKSGPRRLSLIALSGMIMFTLTGLYVLATGIIRRESDKSSLDDLKDNLIESFPRTNRMINRVSEMSKAGLSKMETSK